MSLGDTKPVAIRENRHLRIEACVFFEGNKTIEVKEEGTGNVLPGQGYGSGFFKRFFGLFQKWFGD